MKKEIPKTKMFASKERDKFFETAGIPFWDAFYEKGEEAIDYPYALYYCHKENPATIKELQHGSVMVAKVFDRVLQDIKGWTDKELARWCFNPKYRDLFSMDWDRYFCMRVGWGKKNDQWKIVEINSQTPAVWVETEKGNPLLARHFGLKNPHPGSMSLLRQSMNDAIEAQLSAISEAGTKCVIGFVTADYYEDLAEVSWLAGLSDYDYEVVTIDNLDFTTANNRPFNLATGHTLDAIILWYPIEWLVELSFSNGEPVWPVFISALKARTFVLVHALPAFFIQPKSILVYITENQDNIFKDELASARAYFPETYLSPEFFGDSYFAKPVWGREGRGCMLVKEGQITMGRYQDDYYTSQQMVYQELLELPKIELGDRQLTLQYEQWVYRTGDELKPGGLGVRATEHLITDDYSYWLPIGL